MARCCSLRFRGAVFRKVSMGALNVRRGIHPRYNFAFALGLLRGALRCGVLPLARMQPTSSCVKRFLISSPQVTRSAISNFLCVSVPVERLGIIRTELSASRPYAEKSNIGISGLEGCSLRSFSRVFTVAGATRCCEAWCSEVLILANNRCLQP